MAEYTPIIALTLRVLSAGCLAVCAARLVRLYRRRKSAPGPDNATRPAS